MVSAQSFPGLVLLGIAVLSSLHMFYRDRPPGEDLLHLALTVIGRVLITTAFVESSFLFFSFLAIPFGLVVFCILEYVAFRYVMRRRMALLSVLAVASRRWMPLPPAVAALASEYGWPMRQRCRHLAELLNAGVPLGEALRVAGERPFLPILLMILLFVCFPVILPFGAVYVFILSRAGGLAPPRAVAFVEVGVRTGNISGALAEAARSPAAQPLLARVWAALWYLGGLLLFGMLILSFMAIKIVPAFVKIFDDFDAELPTMTRLLIHFCDWFVTFGWPPLALGLLGAASFALLRIFGVVSWLPPPFSAFSRRRESVVVLRALALTTEVSRPVDLALSALAEHYPSEALGRRLRVVLAQMAEGQPWADSLAGQGLLRSSELAIVRSAERAGNLTWALRDLADAMERRVALRLQRWLEILVPMLVLAAGAIVMFIMVALFIPLVSLITRLL